MSHTQSYSDVPNDGISVMEIGDAGGGGSALFAGLLDAYQGQAYERGYRRAVADVLAEMLLLSEEFLRTQPDGQVTTRTTLYRFQAFIERRFEPSHNRDFVSEGLGI